jgi:predicted dehydrogenase
VSYDPAGSSDYRFERLLYDDPDVKAVVVATPSMWHEGPLRAAVERGKHVLIEKPISTGTGGLLPILTSAQYKQLVIMMGNNLRFHPGVKRAQEFIESGVAGAPRWANFICATEWTSTAERDGVILNTGAHEVDLALDMFGPAVVLSAVADPVPILRPGTADCDVNTIKTERWADFVLQHDSGVRSTFHIDIDTPNRLRQFWISFDQENICVDLDRRTFWRPKSNDGTYLGGDYAGDYASEMINFVQRIEGADVKLGATGAEGWECLHVLLEIKRKAGV